MKGSTVEDEATSAALEEWRRWNGDVTGAELDYADVAATVSMIVDKEVSIEKGVEGASGQYLFHGRISFWVKAIR